MVTIDFFAECPRMRGFQGSTFREFYVETDLDNLTDWSMHMLLEQKEIPGSIALVKNCGTYSEPDEKGFYVQLLSTDTEALCGLYTMYFILTSPNDMQYVNLIGTLEVLPRPQEVEA